MSFKTDTDPSTLALAPSVRMFVYAVIKTMKNQNMSKQKHILHADMIPKLSEKVMGSSLGERTLNYNQQSISISQAPEQEPAKNIIPNQNIKHQANVTATEKQTPSMMEPQINAPERPVLSQPRLQQIPQGQPSQIPQQNQPPMQTMPEQGTQPGDLTQFYGKISSLLNDPSISVIECSGAGKPLMIIRRGQKQPSKIILTENEIKQILDKVSEAAHIPLMEGVFRAAVDTFSINAIISDMIGSRFIIKINPVIRSPPQGMPSQPMMPSRQSPMGPPR